MAGSMIIGNLRTPMDYKKAVQTQDELLRIAIANEMNVIEARKQFQSGEPLLPTEQDLKTPAELQADDAFQEQTALQNLLKLFPYREASTILTNLSRDQRFVLNMSFPDIENDLSRRFNVKLINPQFFLDYLNRYVEELNASKGVSTNLAFVTNKFNELTTNIDDIRSNLPTIPQLGTLLNILSKKYKKGSLSQKKPIYDRVYEIQKSLPDEETYNNINELPISVKIKILDAKMLIITRILNSFLVLNNMILFMISYVNTNKLKIKKLNNIYPMVL